VTRRRIVAGLVAEGAAIGAAGSLLGLVAGHALALAVLRFVGADLGSGYFRGVVPALRIEAATAAVFFVLGVAAAVAGAWLPAREAVRTPPAPGPEGGRCRARLRAAGVRLAGGGAARRGNRRGVAAAGGRPAAVRLRRHRAAAVRHPGADAPLRAPAAARGPAAALAGARARAGAAARRARAGDRQPRRDRGQRQPDGVDGDHGVVVPQFGRRLARRILPADVYVRAPPAATPVLRGPTRRDRRVAGLRASVPAREVRAHPAASRVALSRADRPATAGGRLPLVGDPVPGAPAPPPVW
jgi:putative ABC transport system permease protein